MKNTAKHTSLRLFPFKESSRAITATLTMLEKTCVAQPCIEEHTRELCQSLSLAKAIAGRIRKYSDCYLGRILYEEKGFPIDTMIATMRGFEKILPALYESDAAVRQVIDQTCCIPSVPFPSPYTRTVADKFMFCLRQSTREAEAVRHAMTFSKTDTQTPSL